MRSGRQALLVLLASLLAGCAVPPFDSPPAPVHIYAMPVVHGEGDEETVLWSRAQAIVHGRRAITVAHGFQGSAWGMRPPMIVRPGGRRSISVAGVGAYPHTRPPGGGIDISQRVLDSSMEDWVAFEAEGPLGDQAAATWRVSATEPAFGELLYAVRETGAGRFQRVPLRREPATFGGLDIPDRLYLARGRGTLDMRGWSGSFVGRRDGDGWELVGMLVGGFDADGNEQNGREILFIIRPPDAVLRWLLGEDVALPVAPPLADP